MGAAGVTTGQVSSPQKSKLGDLWSTSFYRVDAISAASQHYQSTECE